MRLKLFIALGATAIVGSGLPAAAQTNDFFGGQVPQSPPGVEAATQRLNGPGGGDYTDDEKRMQRKYKGSLARARQLIAKGEKMMKDGQSKNDDKMTKKGKMPRGMPPMDGLAGMPGMDAFGGAPGLAAGSPPPGPHAGGRHAKKSKKKRR